jgi:cytochrome c553
MKSTNHPSLSSACAFAVVTLVAFASAARADEASPDAAKLDFFEKKIRPILADHCYQCHSADTKPSGGLRVDDLHGLLLGGDAGPAIIAGKPEESLILERVQHGSKKVMPKEGDLLTDAEIADLTQWIKDGVAWPREKIPPYIGRKREDFEELKARHWAWQPLKQPSVPTVADASWPRSDIDRFVLAGLEAKKLAPVADADRVTLIRRVTFDLTGLPPTPADIETFQKDASPDAFAKVVDRLLASTQFGERWGRHWLDVARYGESTGPSRNIPYPHAWKYRDYVIDAVNRDVPFNRFIQEQIAGDLLPAATSADRDRQLTATGFLALGVKDVNQRFKTRFIMDNVDEQIDAVSRSFLALTVSCARCHDHKFDPIPTTDYYALAGIFTSTDDAAGVRNKMGGGGLDYYDPSMLLKLTSAAPEPPAEEVAKLKADFEEKKKAWDAIRGTPEGLKPAANGKPTQRPYRLAFEKAQAELAQLTDPAARGLAVHGVREGKAIADTEVRIRGEAERLGPTVPRGFLTTFKVPDAPTISPQESGRLELAQWLSSAQNPLTARVAVNRVWQHLFGDGIVTTVDNFGVKGDTPSNPELLDHLAQEFIHDGWSVKTLIRQIVLSHAYQLSGDVPSGYRDIDPADRLIWRHAPRRLDAEEMRDTMLASAGRLQTMPPEASPAKALRMVEMRDNGVEAKQINEAADHALYRSVYLPLLRGVTPKALEAFDPVSQTLVTGQREATTVPTQALFLLNSTFVRQQALAFAEKVTANGDRPDGEWIRDIYQLTLGRSPNPQEIERATAFIGEYASSWQQGASAAPQVVAVSATTENTDAGVATAVAGQAANPDDADRAPVAVKEDAVEPKSARAAAWMTFIQALYASAEFRFVR